MSVADIVAEFFLTAFLDHADGCDQPVTCIHAREDRQEAQRLAFVFLHQTLADHGLSVQKSTS